MNTQTLKQQYKNKKQIIQNRLNEFSKVSGNDIFYELCFCLLTPQSKARRCWTCVVKLKEKDFIHKNINPLNYLIGVRFPKNKTKYLLEAKKDFFKIKTEIEKIENVGRLRDWLVENVKGLGYKEASHFLRNIGYKNLAILDRHILKNLLRQDVIKEVPRTLTKNKYLEIETKMQSFAGRVNIPMDELDLLFWSLEAGEVFK